MSTGTTRMGRLQFRIMQILWRDGTASARAVTDELAEQGPISHSTVQTILRKLETKGAVAHDSDGRVFTFRPIVRPNDVRLAAARDVVSRLFDGSVSGLVAHLLTADEVAPEELDRLRDLISEHRKRG